MRAPKTFQIGKIQFNLIEGVVFGAILIYSILKAIHGGNDINVYLYASKQLFEGSNIYINNPYNDYLYSPSFAFLLRPLSILPLVVGRVIWAVINVCCAFRVYQLSWNLLGLTNKLSNKKKLYFGFLLAVVSFGFFNHNIILGQISLLMLWLSMEGLYRGTIKKQFVIAGSLIAMGINIKIIPVLLLYYLFVKRSYKTLSWTIGSLIILFLIPAIYFDWSFTLNMTLEWFAKINPQNAKYVVENNPGTVSINSFIASFFYFEDSGLPRSIFQLELQHMLLLIRLFQIAVALLLLFPFLKKGNSPKHFFWQWTFLWIATLLIFPHQQKYALVYLVPTFMLLLAYWMEQGIVQNVYRRVIVVLLVGALTFSGLLGRDILGSTIVDFFDYYKWFSWLCFALLIASMFLKPKRVWQ